MCLSDLFLQDVYHLSQQPQGQSLLSLCPEHLGFLQLPWRHRGWRPGPSTAMLLHLQDCPLRQLDRNHNTVRTQQFTVLTIFTAHTRRCYLCVPSLASQPAELHEVVSEHRAEVLGAVWVSHPGHQGVLGHRAGGQDGLHQCKVAVSEQMRVLLPLTANFPQSDVWEGPDSKSAQHCLEMIHSPSA